MPKSQDGLVKELITEGYLKTPLIIEAFKKIDRKDFVPEEVKSDAYLNTALPIGSGQTISQPLVVAFMLELLDPRPGERILDIGAGSGWKAALLAYCVGEKGEVISIERIPELEKMAEQNIAKYNFIEKGITKIILGDGSSSSFLLKVGENKKFDKIIAGAAGEKIPDIWKEQLEIGGRLAVPVKHSILVMDKKSEQEFITKERYGFSFVPLISD